MALVKKEDHDYLLREITASLLHVVSISPNADFKKRCFAITGSKNGADFEETLDEKLRKIFELPPRSDHSLAPSPDSADEPEDDMEDYVKEEGSDSSEESEEEPPEVKKLRLSSSIDQKVEKEVPSSDNLPVETMHVDYPFIEFPLPAIQYDPCFSSQE